ncbi:resolvase [Nitrosopumilus cobalaminigenes]|uniref:Resolvase n=1 Tax=Nitrosopumilus cobalaminigenes TaxID=1470066 RepID=A0A7D5M0J9_9ARCH|nr:resolvase [Nitrosopumilus cobalaminigenes]QLH02891.1 resolvase [Nitrosopumilus cobalaminigenes]
MVLRHKRPSFTITKQKTGEKSILNNQKAARTRRQRGYQWEDTIVKRFKSTSDWKAFRLGSPSIALPDVLAVNTTNSTIFTIEAKSGTSTSLPVPADQIERCLDWIKTFDIYKKRNVLLAFKFLSKKRIGVGEYESRELREYFKIWDESLEITDCVCTYEGKFFAKIDGTRKELFLKECKMPFKTKQRTSA